MRRKKVLGSLFGVLALGSLSLLSVGAQADPAPLPDSTYACTFTGVAGQIDTTGDPAGVDPILDDIDPGGANDVDLDQDTGTYTFNSRDPGSTPANQPAGPDNEGAVVCVHADGDADEDGIPNGESGVYLAKIVSGGNFQNTICGTGVASSDDDVGVTRVDLLDSGSDTQGDLESALDAADGTPDDSTVAGPPGASEAPVTGVQYDIAFVSGVGTLEIHSAENANSETGGGHGVVDIVPDETSEEGGNCVNEGVQRFLVQGAFEATLDDVDD